MKEGLNCNKIFQSPVQNSNAGSPAEEKASASEESGRCVKVVIAEQTLVGAAI